MNYCADICRTQTTNLIRTALIESPCGLRVTYCISMRTCKFLSVRETNRASERILQSAQCPIQKEFSIEKDNNHNQAYIYLLLSICLMLDYYLVVD